MEPDDIPVHDLLGVGDEEAPGPDPLRAIVARAGRRRLRLGAAGMAVALAAGGAIGFAVSNHGSSPAPSATATAPAGSTGPSGSTAAAPDSGSKVAPGASSSGMAGGAMILEPGLANNLTRLFNRTAGGVTVRGFITAVALPRIALPSCQLGGPAFQAEVSTANMVGLVFGGFPTTPTPTAVSSVSAQIVGSAEGDPTAVVTVATGRAVAKVRMDFAGGGSDQMAPVKGWAALVAPVAGSASQKSAAAFESQVGQLTAFDSSGHQLASMTVTTGSGFQTGGPVDGTASQNEVAPSIACLPPCPPVPALPATTAPVASSVNPGGPMTGSAGAGSGSVSGSNTGSGASGSAAVASGTPPSFACPLGAPGAAAGSSGSGSTSPATSVGGTGA
jgi:hypothetical protein